MRELFFGLLFIFCVLGTILIATHLAIKVFGL